MKLIKSIILLFFVIISIQNCAQDNSNQALTMKRFKERISKNDTAMVILDVRTSGEIIGELPKIKGAIHIPVQELEDRVNELEQFRNKEIVIVCRTQNRSSKAAVYLKGQGYNAKYVTGGMQEYYKN